MGASGLPSFGSLLPSDPEDVPHGREKTVFAATLLLAIGAALVDAFVVACAVVVDATDVVLDGAPPFDVVASFRAEGPPRKMTAATMASTTASTGINARRSIRVGAHRSTLRTGGKIQVLPLER